MFKILTAIALLDFCLVFFLFGINFTKVFHESFPLADPIKYYNGCIVYLILIVFLLQLFFLKRKNNFIKSYLHLPIHRWKVISYILGLEFFNVFNLYIVLFTFSFAMVNVLPKYGGFSFTVYILSICILLGFTTCFTFLVKTLCKKSLVYILIPTILIIVVLIQRILYQKSFEKLTEVLFDNILQRNYLIMTLFNLLIIIFTIFVISLIKPLIYNVLNYRSKNDLKFRFKKRAPLKALRNPYFLIEISLVLRNKRVRSIFMIAIYLIILTYILFLIKPINDTYTLFFWYLCLSGVWGYSYLQYVFSFEGSFFDFISTASFNIYKYLQAKYFSIVFISLIIISTICPLVLIRNLNLHIIASAFLYNIGIGYFITLYSGTLNKTKVDLNSSILFNYQGYNSVQIISMSFAVCLPLVLLVFISSYLTQSYSLIILNILSIGSLLNYKKWFQIICKQISKRKYVNLEGYRQ
jgi:hypothetical protein